MGIYPFPPKKWIECRLFVEREREREMWMWTYESDVTERVKKEKKLKWLIKFKRGETERSKNLRK